MSRVHPKLVHITTVPESLGFLAGQVGFMKSHGFEIHSVSSPGELLTRFADREQVMTHAVEMTRQITPLRDLLAILILSYHLVSLRPSVVHAHTPKGGLLGMIAAWLGRVPVRIYDIWGLPFMTASGYRRLLLRWSEKVSCLLAHQVICVSHSVRDVAVQEGLCPPGKIKVLLGGSVNGVDALSLFNPERVGETARVETRSRYGIPSDALVIGFVGRIVRDKGLVELAEAWKVLREEVPSLHLLIAGPFESQDPVPPDVERLLHADPRIHLTGPTRDTPQVYAAIDLLVLPTYREGFPNVPLEAAAMRVPVVATRIPGCVDAVQDGMTGMLVPPGDSDALAVAIRMYLNDPALRRSHGSAGRERVLSEFRQELIWAAVYQEYVRLLGKKGVAVLGPLD